MLVKIWRKLFKLKIFMPHFFSTSTIDWWERFGNVWLSHFSFIYIYINIFYLIMHNLFHFSWYEWVRDVFTRRFWWIECDLTAHTFSSFIHLHKWRIIWIFLFLFLSRLLLYLLCFFIHILHSLLIIIHLWRINLLCAIKDQNSMSNKMTERWEKSVKC